MTGVPPDGADPQRFVQAPDTADPQRLWLRAVLPLDLAADPPARARWLAALDLRQYWKRTPLPGTRAHEWAVYAPARLDADGEEVAPARIEPWDEEAAIPSWARNLMVVVTARVHERYGRRVRVSRTVAADGEARNSFVAAMLRDMPREAGRPVVRGSAEVRWLATRGERVDADGAVTVTARGVAWSPDEAIPDWADAMLLLIDVEVADAPVHRRTG